jgi:hypothetical protein
LVLHCELLPGRCSQGTALSGKQLETKNQRIEKRMARQRELLSMTDIAEETGISYATLRNYAVKYDKEIPSEGTGRSTRYPRAAVKIFQRLRKESKPGRKPASASLTPPTQSPAPAPQEEAIEQVSTSAARAMAATADTGGVERELAAIRVHLGSIAESLGRLISNQNTDAVTVPEAAPVEAVPVAAAKASTPEPAAAEAAVTQAKEKREPEGHRRLQSMPKVWGQRGKRPD